MSNPFVPDGALIDPYLFEQDPQTQTLYPADFVAEGCGPGRRTKSISFKKNGQLYTLIAYDKRVPEDLVLSHVRATAMSWRREESFRGVPPGRADLDPLIKRNLEI